MSNQINKQMKKLYVAADEYIFSRCTYKILFLLTTALITIPYIREKIEFFIDILMIYGFVIIGYELLRGKLLGALRSTKTAFFLGGFALSYAITILINQMQVFNGFKTLAFMVLFFVLFFLFPQGTTKEQITKEIKIVSAVIVVITSILSAISFILYVFSISGTYTTGNGIYQAYYGMFEFRLWGLYNPNTSATLTIISILLSISFILAKRKKRVIIPLIINIFIQFSVLLLTGSRAGYYVLAGATAFGVFFGMVYVFKNFTVKNASIAILSATVSLLIFFAVGAVLREGLAYVPGLTTYVLSEPEEVVEEAKIEQKERIDKVDLDRFEDPNAPESTAFANRLDIWQASFKEFCEAPIFGVGRENVVNRATENLKDKKWSYHFKFGNTHNIYLCVLVSSGIVGFLILGSFAVITAGKSAKYVAKTYKKINIWFLSSFIMCLMMYATEFVESRILYKVCIFSTLFWIYCGYMYKLSKLEEADQTEQDVLK